MIDSIIKVSLIFIQETGTNYYELVVPFDWHLMVLSDKLINTAKRL